MKSIIGKKLILKDIYIFSSSFLSQGFLIESQMVNTFDHEDGTTANKTSLWLGMEIIENLLILSHNNRQVVREIVETKSGNIS